MFIWEKFEFNAKDLGLSRSLFSGEKTLNYEYGGIEKNRILCII